MDMEPCAHSARPPAWRLAGVLRLRSLERGLQERRSARLKTLVRRVLNRGSKRGGRGARAYPWSEILGKFGVRRLTRDKQAPPAASLT